MKQKFYFSLLILIGLGVSSFLTAQTDPGTTNLKHQWTFDEGTATDHVGNVTGTLHGNAKLANKGLNTTGNGYMSLPAADIGISSYPEITTEIWCTSDAGKNTGWTMLSYFGASTSGNGNNCTFVSIARADDGSMAALETAGFWDGVTGPEYDDGRLHHFVSTINSETIKFYIDGTLVAVDTLTAGNSIANISTSLAYLGRGGWTADPNWLGVFHKFSLYDKALNDQEIVYLYQEGAESQSVISATMTSLALDNDYPAEMFNVTSANLSGDVTLQAPAGIMLEPSTIPANQNDIPLAVIWDMTTPVDGNLVLTSGTTELIIPIKTVQTDGCYTPLYADIENIVPDPGVNNLANFSGWGEKAIVSIITDPTNVYCGANSAVIGDGIKVGSGSINVDFTNMIQPMTTYRIRAMVKTLDGTFQLGVLGYELDQPDINYVVNTEGEWMPIDFTFTTGAVMGDVRVMFFNNYLCTGTKAYIDNWEMFEYPEPTLVTNKTEIAMDPDYKEELLVITGSNMSNNLTLSAPEGISFSKTTVVPNEEGKITADSVMVSWDGINAIEGTVQINTGTSVLEIPMKTITTSNATCYEPLYTDKPNLVPDPYLNNPAMFGGWGVKRLVSVVTKSDSIFCGSHSGLIDGQGSIDVILNGIVKKNTSYQARVQVRTFGGAFQLGVFGLDAVAGGDVQDSIDTQEAWAPISLQFTTSDSLAAEQGMFINNYERSGKRAFVDNWELYEIAATGVQTPELEGSRVFMLENRIVVDFSLESAQSLQLRVFNLQGSELYSETIQAASGHNIRSLPLNLNKGIYLVSLRTKNQRSTLKLVHN